MEGLASPFYAFENTIISLEDFRVNESAKVGTVILAGAGSMSVADAGTSQGVLRLTAQPQPPNYVGLNIRDGRLGIGSTRPASSLEILARNPLEVALETATFREYHAATPSLNFSSHDGSRQMAISSAFGRGMSVGQAFRVRSNGQVCFGTEAEDPFEASLQRNVVVHGDLFSSGTVTHAETAAPPPPLPGSMLVPEFSLHECQVKGAAVDTWHAHTFHAPVDMRIGLVLVVQKGCRMRRVVKGISTSLTADIQILVDGNVAATAFNVPLDMPVAGHESNVYVREEALTEGLTHAWPLQKDVSPSTGEVAMGHSGTLDMRSHPPQDMPTGFGALRLSRSCNVRTMAPLDFSHASWTLTLWYYCEKPTIASPMASSIVSAGTQTASLMPFRLFRMGHRIGLTTDVFGREVAMSTSDISVRAWHHLAVVRQGSRMMLYVDAQLQGHVEVPHDTRPAYLAMPQTTGGMCDFYQVCDLRFYSRSVDAITLERFQVRKLETLASLGRAVVSPELHVSAGETASVRFRFPKRWLDVSLPKASVRLYAATPDRFSTDHQPPRLMLADDHDDDRVCSQRRAEEIMSAHWSKVAWQGKITTESNVHINNKIPTPSTPHEPSTEIALTVGGDVSLPRHIRCANMPSTHREVSDVHVVDLSMVTPIHADRTVRRAAFVRTVSPVSLAGVVATFSGPHTPDMSFAVLLRLRDTDTGAIRGERVARVVLSPRRQDGEALGPPSIGARPVPANHWPLTTLTRLEDVVGENRLEGVETVDSDPHAIFGSAMRPRHTSLTSTETVRFSASSWTMFLRAKITGTGATEIVDCGMLSVLATPGAIGIRPSGTVNVHWLSGAPVTSGSWFSMAIVRNVHSAVIVFVEDVQLGSVSVHATFGDAPIALARSDHVSVNDVAFYERSLAQSEIHALSTALLQPSSGRHSFSFARFSSVMEAQPSEELEIFLRPSPLFTAAGRLRLVVVPARDSPEVQFGGSRLSTHAPHVIAAPGSLTLPQPRETQHVATKQYVDDLEELHAPLTIAGAQISSQGALTTPGGVDVDGRVTVGAVSPGGASVANVGYADAVLRHGVESPGIVRTAGDGTMEGSISHTDASFIRSSGRFIHMIPQNIRPVLFARSGDQRFPEKMTVDFAHWIGLADHGSVLQTLDGKLRLLNSGDVHCERLQSDILTSLAHTMTIDGSASISTIDTLGLHFHAVEGPSKDLVVQAHPQGPRIAPQHRHLTGIEHASTNTLPALTYWTSSNTIRALGADTIDVGNPDETILGRNLIVQGDSMFSSPDSIVSREAFEVAYGAFWHPGANGSIIFRPPGVVSIGAQGGSALNVEGDINFETLRNSSVELLPGWWRPGSEGVTWVHRMMVSPSDFDTSALASHMFVSNVPALMRGGMLAARTSLHLWDAGSSWTISLVGQSGVMRGPRQQQEMFIFENALDARLMSIDNASGDTRVSGRLRIDGNTPGVSAVTPTSHALRSHGNMMVEGDLVVGNGIFREGFQSSFFARKGAWTTPLNAAQGTISVVGSSVSIGALPSTPTPTAQLSVRNAAGVTSAGGAAAVTISANVNAQSSSSGARPMVSLARGLHGQDSTVQLVPNSHSFSNVIRGDVLLAGSGIIVGDAVSATSEELTVRSTGASILGGLRIVSLDADILPAADSIGPFHGEPSETATMFSLESGHAVGIQGFAVAGPAVRVDGLAVPLHGAVAGAASEELRVTSGRAGSASVSGNVTVAGDLKRTTRHGSELNAAMDLLQGQHPSSDTHAISKAFLDANDTYSPNVVWRNSESPVTHPEGAGSKVFIGTEPGHPSLHSLSASNMRVDHGGLSLTGEALRMANAPFAISEDGVSHFSGSGNVRIEPRAIRVMPEPHRGSFSHTDLGTFESGDFAASDPRTGTVVTSAPEGGVGRVVFVKNSFVVASGDSVRASGVFAAGQPDRLRVMFSADGQSWKSRDVRLDTFELDTAWSASNPKYAQLRSIAATGELAGGGMWILGDPAIRPGFDMRQWHFGYFSMDGMLWTPVMGRDVSGTPLRAVVDPSMVTTDTAVWTGQSMVPLPHTARVTARFGGSETAYIAAQSTSFFTITLDAWSTHTTVSLSEPGDEVNRSWSVGEKLYVSGTRALYEVSLSAQSARWTTVLPTPTLSDVVVSVYADRHFVVAMSASGFRRIIHESRSDHSRVVVHGDTEVHRDLFTSRPVMQMSDRRLKQDITTVEPPPVLPAAFRFERSGVSKVGFVTSDVLTSLPELVRGEEMRTVSYEGALAAVVEKIRRLAEAVTSGQASIAKASSFTA